MKDSSSKNTDRAEALAKWRSSKFGMFIHFGLYALPAGVWKEKEVPWIGEWIMHQARIPITEYEKLAARFNPVEFDAEKWVRLAVLAGMKYLVVTAKHHDGFAMFDSDTSDYNIAEATPFGRDLLKELATACGKSNIKLGIYYSHNQDWHEPDAVGNTWDFEDDGTNEPKPDFHKYMTGKALPQVRELLINYGPIALIWYDTPYRITDEHCKEFVDIVRELQPACLVNDRVGAGLGDYSSMGDNEIPEAGETAAWETPMTLNDTWGYKKNDHNWKTPGAVVRMLAETVSKGGNLLLNVGPTDKGVIPSPSVECLKLVGDWLCRNGESIYDALPSPWAVKLPFGTVTHKVGKLYLHVFSWPDDGELVLQGLENTVSGARMLVSGETLPFVRDEQITIDLSHVAADVFDTVVVLDIEGEPEISSGEVSPRDETSILLDATKAKTAGEVNCLNGALRDWKGYDDLVTWQFCVEETGRYTVEITYACDESSRGGDYEVSLAGVSVVSKVESTSTVDCFATHKLSTIEIATSGEHRVSVRALKFNGSELMVLLQVKLILESD